MDKHLENSFDQFIKDSLRDVEVPYDGTGWAAMEEKLIASESAEMITVDEVAKDALQNYGVSYESSTWALLSERLDQIEYNRRLIGLKVVEAAVFILAILTIVRFMAQLPDNQDIGAPSMALHELSESGDIEFETVDEVAYQNIDGLTNVRVDNSTESNQAVKSLNAEINPIASGADDQDAGQFDAKNLGTVPLVQTRNTLVSSMNTRPVRHINHSALIALVNIPFEEVSEMNPTSLDGLEANDGMVAWYAMDKRKIETKIGLFSEMNMHEIVAGTPLPHFGSVHSQAIVNPAFGVMTNVQFGKFGFDFGLGYEEVRYQSVLDFNEVHKVHMPFHLRFTPVDTRLFNLYAKAGVAVHGAMYAKYQTPPLSAAPGFSSRKDSGFNDGLLRGGTVESNIYTTRSVGIGIESPVSRDFSIFGEGLHQSHLGGALSTTTSDRFETISIRFGLNYKFK